MIKDPTDAVNAAVGARVFALRRQRGLTQERLGEQADISYKFLGELERGRTNPSVRTLARIAAVLGVSIRDLFDK